MRVGLIGCGRFGQFCLRAYSALRDVEIVAIADVDRNLLHKVASQFQVTPVENVEDIFKYAEIELLHVATPPYQHFDLVYKALQAGKHVICEKPLTIEMSQARQLIELARTHQRVLVVNFILRYNPLVDQVKQIIDRQFLGEPLHAYFENYASDESLEPQHWFWDKNKSGGIFVEHGVHFFDLYEYWFGNGKVLSAHAEKRPGTGLEDRVTCLLRYDSGVVAHHYHGFDQPSCLDRATHGILFERGDLSIYGWIPLELHGQVLVNDQILDQLKSLFPTAEITELERFNSRTFRGRGKRIEGSQLITFHYKLTKPKEEMYLECIKDLIQDQMTFIKNPKHKRKVTEKEGLQALTYAVTATRQS